MKKPTLDAESHVSGIGSVSELSLSRDLMSTSRRSPSRNSLRSQGYSPSGSKGFTDGNPSRSYSGESDVAFEWRTPPAPSSPIRSNNISSEARREKATGCGRPSSAPARRLSPKETAPSANGIDSRCDAHNGILSEAVHSPLASADSSNIVRKLRSKGLDMRGPNGNAKTVERAENGITFSSLHGVVSKKGSPLRGYIEAARDKLQQTVGDMEKFEENGESLLRVSIPTASVTVGNETSSEEEINDIKPPEGRERRSSSGATSTAVSSESL